MFPDRQEALRGIEWQTFGETVLNPFSFALVVLMGVLILFLPRRYAIIPIIIIALFITSMQRIVIADLDFDMIRIMILFGFMRIFIRAEYKNIKWNKIDIALIFYVAVKLITGTIYWGTTDAFINRLGGVYMISGMYFLCRILIQDFSDMELVIKSVIIMSIPVAGFMLNEQITRNNFFSVLGGVPEITMLREGRLRSQGAFNHPILAGTFGATFLPLVFGYWFRNKQNGILFITGIISCTVITITSSSSGPVMSYIAAMIGMILWTMRDRMKFLVIGAIAGIIGLHIVMKAPVWWLIARVDVVGGSTAAHRARLIEKAIEYFPEWWLLGTYDSGHWGWGLEDVTNWYVRHCIDGGLMYFILLLTIIVLCFKTIGRNVRAVKDQPDLQKFIWAMGACLFSHTISFIGVSYFGQIVFFYLLIIAMISAINSMELNQSQKPFEQTASQK
jgi:hypothetical protein